MASYLPAVWNWRSKIHICKIHTSFALNSCLLTLNAALRQERRGSRTDRPTHPTPPAMTRILVRSVPTESNTVPKEVKVK